MNLNQVCEIKDLIAADDPDGAREYWYEFTEEEQVILWVAPTFGGIFTTEERKRLRPGEK